MAPLTRTLSVLFLLGTFLILLAFLAGHLYSIDGLQYYRSAVSLVFDGRITFSPPLVWGVPMTAPPATIGQTLALVPAVLLAAPLHLSVPPFTSQLYDSRLLYGDQLYIAVSWVNPLAAAATGLLAGHTARALGLTGRAVILSGVAAVFAGPLFFYARADLPQALAALLVVAAVLVALRAHAGEEPRGALAVVAAGLVLVRPVDAVVVSAAVAAFLVSQIPIRRVSVAAGLELIVGGAVGTAGTFLVNEVRRGNPIDFGYTTGFSGSIPQGLVAELLSPGRGMFWYLPLTALAGYGAYRLWRTCSRPALLLFALIIAGYAVVYAQWQGLGGWTWGPRFLVPVSPLLVILAAVGGLKGTGRPGLFGVIAFAGLAAIGVLENGAHLAVDQLRFWSVYGDSVFGTPGFGRQFELGAFAPVGSWHLYDAAAGPDLFWLRQGDATGGWSVVLGALLLAIGAGCITLAFIVAGSGSRRTRQAPVSREEAPT